MYRNIYEAKSYKDYLRSRSGEAGTRTGAKASLARAMQCQATYISQVLHGHADISLEQAERANKYFQHTDEESLYFLLMVQRDRAGTHSLKSFFQKQLDEILTRRLVLTQRLGRRQNLSREHQAEYYSSWIYAATHIALTIPSLRTHERLSEYLCVPRKRISEVLDFLVSIGLAEQAGGEFKPGASHVRLGNDSPSIIKHHANWRNQAIESLDREQITDLHYSGVVSLSRADVVKLKNQLLDFIRDSQELVRDSKEEELCVLNMDFFSLKKQAAN